MRSQRQLEDDAPAIAQQRHDVGPQGSVHEQAVEEDDWRVHRQTL
jgi:hypothetical protein